MVVEVRLSRAPVRSGVVWRDGAPYAVAGVADVADEALARLEAGAYPSRHLNSGRIRTETCYG